MSYNECVLFYLLRAGLETERMFDFVFSEMPDWKWMLLKSSEQGVLPIVYDGVVALEKRKLIPEPFGMSPEMRMEWRYNVARVERVAVEQYALSREFGDIYAEHGIRTVVFKGLSVALLYPNAKHRPCGDMDCFLMGDFDKGNRVAAEIGASVEGYDNIKHTGICFKGLHIENHEFFSHVYGSSRRVEFERELQGVLYRGGISRIGSSCLYSPCVMFHALFLAYHSWRHYLSSGIYVRHICDWAMLLNRYVDVIDWQEFVRILNIEDRGILDYVRCISVIAHRMIGAPLPEIFGSSVDDGRPEKVLKGILNPRTVSNHSALVRKFRTLMSLFIPDWKRRCFSEHGMFHNAYMFFYLRHLNRHPASRHKPEIRFGKDYTVR